MQNFAQIFKSFYEGQLKQQMLYTANIYMLFNPLKMAVQFFKIAPNFPNFDDQNALFPNSTGP